MDRKGVLDWPHSNEAFDNSLPYLLLFEVKLISNLVPGRFKIVLPLWIQCLVMWSEVDKGDLLLTVLALNFLPAVNDRMKRVDFTAA